MLITEKEIEFSKSKIFVEKSDLNQYVKGDEVNFTFIFENNSSNSFKIEEIHPSCTCTASFFDKNIKPFSENKITLTTTLKQFSQIKKNDATVTINNKVKYYYIYAELISTN
ncbi:DUF1573 domain-containing protein [Nitritalea halalkaliphila]|nr:DUF1573 domain-containing protein [Nitritalea halalkaliphila]